MFSIIMPVLENNILVIDKVIILEYIITTC